MRYLALFLMLAAGLGCQANEEAKRAVETNAKIMAAIKSIDLCRAEIDTDKPIGTEKARQEFIEKVDALIRIRRIGKKPAGGLAKSAEEMALENELAWYVKNIGREANTREKLEFQIKSKLLELDSLITLAGGVDSLIPQVRAAVERVKSGAAETVAATPAEPRKVFLVMPDGTRTEVARAMRLGDTWKVRTLDGKEEEVPADQVKEVVRE